MSKMSASCSKKAKLC